ncbi:hypothetical protein PINS_up006520 [Pythium insidiosum]|nr:hypothetical protein PINS_up006520 [Pythium insidiosum]
MSTDASASTSSSAQLNDLARVQTAAETARETPPSAGADAADGGHARGAPASASTPSFRKFRELLMAKHFENRDNEPVEVVPRVFLGSLGAATNRAALAAHGISHVVCVSPTLSLAFPSQLSYLRLAVADTPDASIAHEFDRALQFIDSDPTNAVLVHCFVGRSRSVTVVTAYLMARHSMSLSQALERVRLVRPQARPNSGFLAQLRCYEAQLVAVTRSSNSTRHLS